MSKLKAILISGGLIGALAGAALGQSVAQPPDKRSTAYYNFSMGHLYAELAATYGYRSDYVDKAIQHYRAALEADPGAGYISEELTDLYMQSGKLRDAVTEAEEILRRDPDNLDARRMLGRIYARLIGDQQTSRIDDKMLKKAIEQYEKVTEKDPNDSDSWLMLGRLYQVAQNSAQAEKAYKKALTLDPDNEFALSRLALLYSDVGNSSAALEIWRKLADKDPRPQHLRALAEAYEQTHDYKAAAQTLRRALEAAPRDPELKDKLAEYLLLANQPDEALKIYNDLAAGDPKNASLQLRISQVYRAKHDLANARAALERARAIDPDNAEVQYDEVFLLEDEGKTGDAIAKLQGVLDAKKTYSPDTRARLLDRLGSLYRSSERFPEAVDAFRKMAAANPEAGANSSAEIIDTYRQARDFTKAQQEAEAAYKKYPNNRMIKLLRASLLADLGQTDEAAAAIKQLLDGRNDRQTYLALAQVYEKGKRFKEEAETLGAAEKLSGSPDEKKEITFFRGAMYERMNKIEAAEEEFRKVLELDPDNAAALNYLGYMLADRNVRLEEARKLIIKALEVEPRNGAYLDSLGWVNFRMGRLDDAETYLRQALERTANDPTVHEHLGDVYAQKGRLKDAIQQWELSLKNFQLSSKAEQDPVEVAKIQKKLESARVRLAKESGAAANR